MEKWNRKASHTHSHTRTHSGRDKNRNLKLKWITYGYNIRQMISNSIHNGSCYFLRLTLVVVCISNQDVWIVISIFIAKNSVSKTLANKTEIKSHWYSSVELHTYSIHVNDRSNSALLRLKMTDELLISKFPTTLRFLLSRCIPIIQQSIWNLKHLNERNKTRRDQITQDRNQYSPKKSEKNRNYA